MLCNDFSGETIAHTCFNTSLALQSRSELFSSFNHQPSVTSCLPVPRSIQLQEVLNCYTETGE